MYSIVLMAALSTSGEVPDFGRRHGCSGGCYGGGWSGCHRGWSGCCGGGGWGGCSGGGCWGGCSRGCWGGCYGGGYVSSGCYGSCWGGGCWGGGSMTGGGWGGGYVGGGYYGGGSYGGGSPLYAAPPMFGASLQPSTVPVTQPASTTRRATIVVNLPADARLTVDGTKTNSTSGRRVFVSPPLEPGNYTYTLRAQVNRGGEMLETTRQVAVQPGRKTEVTLDIPAVAATASR